MKLADIRKERRMSQRELAAALACSQARISRLERGKVRADAQTLARLADALRIDLGEATRACLTR